MDGRTVGVLACLLCAVVSCAGLGEPSDAPRTGGSVPGAAGPGSGVAGVAVVDAGCAVLEGSAPCPELPLRARIVVLRDGSTNRVTAVESGTDGRFRVELAPGRYVLKGENLAGTPVPTAMPVPVTVAPGRFVAATVRFDSGIRGAPAGP